eukprot:15460415-Alexandrium_andersonii.AAC.1
MHTHMHRSTRSHTVLSSRHIRSKWATAISDRPSTCAMSDAIEGEWRSCSGRRSAWTRSSTTAVAAAWVPDKSEKLYGQLCAHRVLEFLS